LTSLIAAARERFPRLYRLASPVLARPGIRTTLRGASWSVTGAAAGRIFTLASSVMLGRFLGAAGLGEYGILNSTTGTLGPLGAMQTGLTATKYVAECRGTDLPRVARIMAVSTRVAAISGGVTALALMAASQFIAHRCLAAPGLTGPLAISAIFLLFNSLSSSQTGAIAGFAAFKELAWIGAVSGVISFPLVVGGAYYFGITGVAVAWVIGGCVTWRINSAVLRKICRTAGVPARARPEREDYKILWRFSLPSMLASTISGPAAWAANAVLVNQAGGYREMGIFAAANQWRTPVLFVASAMSAVVVPVLANVTSSDGVAGFKSALRFNVALNGAVAVAGALPIALLAPVILSWYGKEFRGGTTTFLLLQVSAVLAAIGWVYGSAVVSQGRMRIVLLTHVASALALVTGAMLLVPKYRAVGLAWTVTLQAFVFLAISFAAIALKTDK